MESNARTVQTRAVHCDVSAMAAVFQRVITLSPRPAEVSVRYPNDVIDAVKLQIFLESIIMLFYKQSRSLADRCSSCHHCLGDIEFNRDRRGKCLLHPVVEFVFEAWLYSRPSSDVAFDCGMETDLVGRIERLRSMETTPTVA